MTDETASTEEARGERDPLEKVDMSNELVDLRKMFQEHGLRCLSSSGNGEIWAQSFGGMPGYKCQLMMDQGGRIRAEIFDPRGLLITMVSPAMPVDVEAAMRRHVSGW